MENNEVFAIKEEIPQIKAKSRKQYTPSQNYDDYQKGKEFRLSKNINNRINGLINTVYNHMEQKNDRVDRESKEIKKSKEKVTTMNQIVELFKNNKIDEVIVAGEKIKIPNTKEAVLGLKPDLDAYMAMYLLNEYNNKSINEIYNENSKTTIVKKNGQDKNIHDGNNKLEKFVKPYKDEMSETEPTSKLVVYIDNGGEWLKIEKDGIVSTVYIDHHGPGNKPATSGTKMMLEIMRKADMLKELPPWTSKLINFTNDIDNLSYINKKDRNKQRTFNESYFRNEWPNSLYALAEKQIPFETLIELFKSGLIKDPTKPFTEKELAGKLGSFMVGESSIRDLCKQKMVEVSNCLENGINKSIKHNKNLNLETNELGKIIYNNFFIEKGKANTIPNHLAVKATIAKGFDTFISWNKKNDDFFINSIESKSLGDIAKRLNEKFPDCANEVRGKFIFGKINDMTEEEFLEIIGPNILNSEDKEKREAELKQKEVEKKKEELYIRIEEYRKNLKSYNEEKIRLNNLLQELNDKLDLSIKKDEEDYQSSLKKEPREQKTVIPIDGTDWLDEYTKEEQKQEESSKENVVISDNTDIKTEEITENSSEEKARLDDLLKVLNEKLILAKQENKLQEIEAPINIETLPEIKNEEVDSLIFKKDEKNEIQQESLDQSIEEVAENQVVEQTNNETENAEDVMSEELVIENELATQESQNEVAEIEKEITVLEPKQIKVEEIIDENLTPEEKKELQAEFPNQNIEEIIENEVVEQINDKTIVPVEERKKDTQINKIGRKVKRNFLAILISASSFHSAGIFNISERADVLSYNNIKVENLKDWENVKLHEDEINKLENISIITKAHENSNDKYLIIDKQNGKAHRYQGDSLIKSYNVCLGDSIGDEQTFLKSAYKKILRELGTDQEGDMTYDTEDVSIKEATYTKDGELYLKDGYQAWTDWGTGNMRTGAGIYTISNKGPFLDDFGIFLKNERGSQVATSLHVNSHLKTNSPKFRFTNGCVGFSKEDLMELYEITSSGENIYIMPDNPHNKFQIVDGELRFLSNQQNVNRTIRPYESKPLLLKAEKPTETAKVWLMTLSENKTKLMSLYPTISNDIYNELAKIAYGIMGQESTFGTYGGPRGQFGRVKDIGASTVGFKPSVGPGQVRLENVNKKIIDAFNIKRNEDLFDTKTNAIATMSILLDNYLYISYNEKEDKYKELVILKYNAALEAKRITKGNKKLEQLGPITRSYIKKVLNYSKLAKVYTTNTDEDYYNPNWNYGQPNNLAMNNINN